MMFVAAAAHRGVHFLLVASGNGESHPAHLKYLQHRKWINIQAVTHLVVHFGSSTAYKIHVYNTLLEGKWKPQ